MCVCVCISVVVFLLYQQSVRDHRNSASHTGDDDDDDVQRHSILNNDTFQEFFNARSKFPSHADMCATMSKTEGTWTEIPRSDQSKRFKKIHIYKP